jgi:hypothetical protein
MAKIITHEFPQSATLTSTSTSGFCRRLVDRSFCCNRDNPRNAKNFGRLRRSASVNVSSAVVRRDMVSQARSGKFTAHLIGRALPPSRLRRKLVVDPRHDVAEAVGGIKARNAIEIKRSGSQPSGMGPSDYFTGAVRLDPWIQEPRSSAITGASITFEPGVAHASSARASITSEIARGMDEGSEHGGVPRRRRRDLGDRTRAPRWLWRKSRWFLPISSRSRGEQRRDYAALHSAAVEAPAGTTLIVACDSARSSAGPICWLKFSAQLITPT